jgi:hypothetical protein
VYSSQVKGGEIAEKCMRERGDKRIADRITSMEVKLIWGF